VIGGHMDSFIKINIYFSFYWAWTFLCGTHITLLTKLPIVFVGDFMVEGSYEPPLRIGILGSIHSIVWHYTSAGFQYNTLILFKKRNNQGQDVSIPIEQSWVVIMPSYM
jgi:hypothetical protein